MNYNLSDSFSYIGEDKGYLVMKHNWRIDVLVPFKNGIDPRLIRFLRDLLYHKMYNIQSCVPLYMKYHVKKEDWEQIANYIKKYKISVFYKYKFRRFPSNSNINNKKN